MKNQNIYEKLYALQSAYNAHTNITRISSREDFYLKHIEDSLALLPFVEADASRDLSVRAVRVIDIGTGAGYPGLPLAIEQPQLQVTLNDATLKKIKYVQSVVEELALPNAKTIWARAEDLSKQKEYKEKYDFVTARAVAEIRELIPLAAPLLKPGGKMLFMKAKNVEAEIAAAKRIAQKEKLKLKEIHKYKLADMDRAIVVYEKEGKCSASK